MITTLHSCARCQGTALVRNGTNSANNPKYKCKTCGFSGVLVTRRKSATEKEQAVAAYQERASARGVGRIFGISHQTALNWVKKKPAPWAI